MAQGYTSYRAIGDFAKSNREYLTRYFHFLRSSVPSYSTIRRAMINIDHDQVIEVFNDWANMIAHSNHQIKDDDHSSPRVKFFRFPWKAQSIKSKYLQSLDYGQHHPRMNCGLIDQVHWKWTE